MGALNIPLKLLLLGYLIVTANSSPIKTKLSKTSQNAPRHPFASISNIKTVSTTTSPPAQTSEHGNSQRKISTFGNRVGVKTSQLIPTKQFTQQDYPTAPIERLQTTTTPVPETINPIRVKTVKSPNPSPIIQHQEVPIDSNIQQEAIPSRSNFGTRISSSAENGCNIKGNCVFESNSGSTFRKDFGESFVIKPKEDENQSTLSSHGSPLMQEVKGIEQDNFPSEENHVVGTTEAHPLNTLSTESNNFAIPSDANVGRSSVKTIPSGTHVSHNPIKTTSSDANEGRSSVKTIPSGTNVGHNPIKTIPSVTHVGQNPVKTISSSTSVGHNPAKTVPSNTNVDHNPSKTVPPSTNVSHNPVKTINNDQQHSTFKPAGDKQNQHVTHANEHSVNRGIKTTGSHNDFPEHSAFFQQQQGYDDDKQLTLSQHFADGGYEGLIPAHETALSTNDKRDFNDQTINSNFSPFDAQQEFVAQVNIPSDDNIHQYDNDGQYYSSLSPLEALLYNVPGNPGEDYPILYQVPETSFSCEQQPYQAGIYGDMDAACQVFHICKENGGQDSFLCPNGTVFNQQFFVCDWWYNYNCSETLRFYNLNAQLYLDIERFTPNKIQSGVSSGENDMTSINFHANPGSYEGQSIVETHFQPDNAGASAEYPDDRSHSSDASNSQNVERNINFEIQAPVESSYDEQQHANDPINQRFITDFRFNDYNQKSEISRQHESSAHTTQMNTLSFETEKPASSSSATLEVPKQQQVFKDFIDNFNQDVYDYEQKMISDSLNFTPQQVIGIPSSSQEETSVEIKNKNQEEQQVQRIEGTAPNKAVDEQTTGKVVADFKPNQLPEPVEFSSLQNDNEQQEVNVFPLSSDSGRGSPPDSMDGTRYPDHSGYVQQYVDDEKAPLNEMPPFQDYNRGTYQFVGGPTFAAQDFQAEDTPKPSVVNFVSKPNDFSANSEDSVQEYLNDESTFSQDQESSNPSFETFQSDIQSIVQRGSEESFGKVDFSQERFQQDNVEPISQQDQVAVQKHSLTINHTDSILGSRPHQNLPALPNLNSAQNFKSENSFEVQQMEYKPEVTEPQSFHTENKEDNGFLKVEAPNKSEEEQKFVGAHSNSDADQMHVQQKYEEVDVPTVSLQGDKNGLKQFDESIQEQSHKSDVSQTPFIRLKDMVRGMKTNVGDYDKNNNADQQQRFNFRPYEQQQQNINIAFNDQTQQPENSYENNYATQHPSNFFDQRNEQTMYHPNQFDISNERQRDEYESSQAGKDYPTETQRNTFQNVNADTGRHNNDENKAKNANTKDYYNQRFIHFQQEQAGQWMQEPENHRNENSDYHLNQEKVIFPEPTKNLNFNQDGNSQSYPSYPTNHGPSNQHFFLTNAHQRQNHQNLQKDRPTNHYGSHQQQFSSAPDQPQVISQQKEHQQNNFNSNPSAQIISRSEQIPISNLALINTPIAINNPQQNFGVKGIHPQQRSGRNITFYENAQNSGQQRIYGNEAMTYSRQFSGPSEASISYNGWRPVIREYN